jgi:hypothetical protein
MVRAIPSLRCLLTSVLLATALPLAATPAAASSHSVVILIEMTATLVVVTEPGFGWTCTTHSALGDETIVHCVPPVSGGTWWCDSRSVDLEASGMGGDLLGLSYCKDDDATLALCSVLLTSSTQSCSDAVPSPSSGMATGEVVCKVKLNGTVVSGVLRCKLRLTQL